jgi:hypothetical protein
VARVPHRYDSLPGTRLLLRLPAVDRHRERTDAAIVSQQSDRRKDFVARFHGRAISGMIPRPYALESRVAAVPDPRMRLKLVTIWKACWYSSGQ